MLGPKKNARAFSTPNANGRHCPADCSVYKNKKSLRPVESEDFIVTRHAIVL